MPIIEPGTAVPEFKLKDAEQEAFTRDSLPEKAILAFFPFAFSPICTDQLSIYEDQVADELRDAGVTLYGVSTDGIWALKAFKEKLGFSFDVLSDFEPKGETAKAFGAYFERGGMTNRGLVAIAGGEVKFSWLGETPGDVPGPDVVREAVAALS